MEVLIVVVFTYPVLTLAQALCSGLYLHDLISSLRPFGTISPIFLDGITETQRIQDLAQVFTVNNDGAGTELPNQSSSPN